MQSLSDLFGRDHTFVSTCSKLNVISLFIQLKAYLYILVITSSEKKSVFYGGTFRAFIIFILETYSVGTIK